jgi:hypothetical protein
MEGFGPNLGVVNFGAVRAEDRPDSGSDTPPCACSSTPRPVSFGLRAPRLVAGRDITWTEVYGLRPVVMISENLARALWGTAAAAIGKHLRQAPEMPGMKSSVLHRMSVKTVFTNGHPQPCTGRRCLPI